MEVGAAWQNETNINDPGVRAFMKKVTNELYPRADETRHQELTVERRSGIERRPSFVQVTARGRVFTEAAEYAKWLSLENAEFRASDEDLAAKFRANSAGVLEPARVEKVIDQVMHLEAIANVGKLMAELAS